MNFIKYKADENHYKEVLSLVGKAKQTVWIGTADIKDLYVDDKPSARDSFPNTWMLSTMPSPAVSNVQQS